MAPELSSNWKRLQATLKNESCALSAQKRKRDPPTERQRNSEAAKRRRVEGDCLKTGRAVVLGKYSPPLKVRAGKMGSWSSTSAAPGDKSTTGATTTTTTMPPEPTHSHSLSLWATENDISASDLAAAYGTNGSLQSTSVLGQSQNDIINSGLCPSVEIGKYIALDCEMVGVGGPTEDRSVLARVSIVNFHGVQVYDSYVRPKEFVTDWRTHVSGITPKHIAAARTFEAVQTDVAGILEGRILVGHALRNDLEVLMLSHPKRDVRDTARLKAYRKLSAGKTPSLRMLAREVLGVEVQVGSHSSVEDARVAMALFERRRGEFEVELAAKGEAGDRSNGQGKAKKKGKGKR